MHHSVFWNLEQFLLIYLSISFLAPVKGSIRFPSQLFFSFNFQTHRVDVSVTVELSVVCPGWPSVDILVRSWQDLGTIVAKILTKYCHGIHFAMVRSYQESHVPKKNLNPIWPEQISKEVNKNHHLSRFTLLDMITFCYQGIKFDWVTMLFRESLTKLLYQLQNRRQQLRRKNLELNHYPQVAMIAVTGSNKAAEIGSKKAGDMNWQNYNRIF